MILLINYHSKRSLKCQVTTNSNRIKVFTISIYTIAVILIGCVIFRFITQWSNTSKLISQLWDILFPFSWDF